MPVTIYTSFGWGPCMVTKSWLKKNNIEYIEKNVNDDSIKDEMFALGYRSTPVVVSEKGTVIGYNPTKLAEFLNGGLLSKDG